MDIIVIILLIALNVFAFLIFKCVAGFTEGLFSILGYNPDWDEEEDEESSG